METGCKNDVNIPFGFTVLNMSLFVDIIWYGQTKYNHHYGGYMTVSGNFKCDT